MGRGGARIGTDVWKCVFVCMGMYIQIEGFIFKKWDMMQNVRVDLECSLTYPDVVVVVVVAVVWSVFRTRPVEL